MAQTDIQVKARAGQLLSQGHSEFEGYRQMSTEKLRKLIEKAEKPSNGKGKVVKGKATDGAKGKAREIVKKAVETAKGKGKPASAPAAKSTTRKSALAKGKATAAKGEAKRPTTKGSPNYLRRSIDSLKAELAKRGLSAGRGRPSVERYAEILSADDRGEVSARTKSAEGAAKGKATGRKPGRPKGSGKGEATPKAKATGEYVGKYAKRTLKGLKNELANRGLSAGRGRPSVERLGLILEAHDAGENVPMKASANKGKPAKLAKPGEGTRAAIDNSEIDWTLETNIGASGKRSIVLKALRKRRGNRDKAFEDVKGHALEWYPDVRHSYPNASNKRDAAERMTRWLVNRVAFDYAVATGQHKQGNRQWSKEGRKKLAHGKGGPGKGGATRKPAKAERSAQGQKRASSTRATKPRDTGKGKPASAKAKSAGAKGGGLKRKGR